MKRKQPARVRTTKFSISLPQDMAAWLRRASQKRRATISYMVREAFLAQFDARHSDRKREVTA